MKEGAVPRWLGSPHIQELLNKLVDRMDNAEVRGSDSAQSLELNAKTWPGLYGSPMEGDKEHLWSQVIQLAGFGWIAVTPVQALRGGDGYDKRPRVRVLDPGAVRLAVGRLARKKTSSELWRAAVDAHLEASEEVKRMAGGFLIELPGHSMEDTVCRLNGLKALATSNLMLREVSARLFWGMSKVLDSRTELVSALLGVEDCPFPEAPLQLQVHLPHHEFTGVLFIENQITFEQAVRSRGLGFKNLALVYASGFKGSAARSRNPELVSLYVSRRGSMDAPNLARFEAWLFRKELTLAEYFWGDLDWSGMRILKALRTNFPTLEAWQPGYLPMLTSLQEGQGHTPEAADKRGQQPVAQTGCRIADGLLIPALASSGGFIDQEMQTL